MERDSTRAGARLIVEDDARQVESGQMRRSEFLARLREDVCRESDDAMRGTGQTTEGCPYVERWFDYYTDKPASHIERALRRYAPEAASATSAGDYIRAASARVRRSVEVWATTGEVTGVPDELASVVMGGTILGAIGGVIGGIASAIGGVVSGIGKAITGLGRLLFKGKEGGARQGAEAGQVSESLNGGESLEGGVRQRMEGAFGRDFSGVRVHRDGQAAAMTDGMNARALTVGQEVVFGSGEYRPGTMVGDALIAHELAHVVQQSGQNSNGALMQKGEEAADSFEEDADIAATNAMISIWAGNNRGLASSAKQFIPRLRSGLKLQRCPKSKPKSEFPGGVNPFAPELALTKEQLLREAEHKKASDERFAKDPNAYDVDFVPDVTIIPGKESYCFDFTQADVDNVCLPPEFGTQGCVMIESPNVYDFNVHVDRKMQGLGTTQIDSPLKVTVKTIPLTYVLYVQTNKIEEGKPLEQNSVLNEELKHIVDDFETTQIFKERVARAVRLRLMEARRQAASNPKNVEALIGQKAIEKIVAEEETPFIKALVAERGRKGKIVHELLNADKLPPVKLPTGFQVPPIKVGITGSVNGDKKGCR